MIENAFDLSILDSGVSGHAVAIARSGPDVALAKIPFGTQLQALLNFRKCIEKSVRGESDRPKANELAKYGRDLFSFAFRDDILELYNRLPRTDVRVQILSNQPDFQLLPFEYLQEPKRRPGPSRERSVVRVVPTIGFVPPLPPAATEKLRVLFASADPTDQGPVSWPEVKSTIQRTFAYAIPSEAKHRVTFDAIEGVDRRRLHELMAQRRFEVFHFSGHGEVVGGQGRIILTNKRTQKSESIDAPDLAKMLSGLGLKLVILSACETATGDFRDDFSVTAEALVRSGIPAVIANQLPIPDASVARFVGPLYECLLRTGDIDLAMNEGRIALALQLATADDATVEWGIPTLYRHYWTPLIYTP